MTWLLKEELCVEVMEVRYDMVVERGAVCGGDGSKI